MYILNMSFHVTYKFLSLGHTQVTLLLFKSKNLKICCFGVQDFFEKLFFNKCSQYVQGCHFTWKRRKHGKSWNLKKKGKI